MLDLWAALGVPQVTVSGVICRLHARTASDEPAPTPAPAPTPPSYSSAYSSSSSSGYSPRPVDPGLSAEEQLSQHLSDFKVVRVSDDQRIAWYTKFTCDSPVLCATLSERGPALPRAARVRGAGDKLELH